MAKNLKASLIVDLLGNISAKSRQWSQELGAFSRSGRTGLVVLEMQPAGPVRKQNLSAPVCSERLPVFVAASAR